VEPEPHVFRVRRFGTDLSAAILQIDLPFLEIGERFSQGRHVWQMKDMRPIVVGDSLPLNKATVYCRTVPCRVIAKTSISSSNVAPWRERICDSLEGKFELRIVPQDNFLHSGSSYPFEASNGIELLPIVRREETIAFQSARCHQNENSKGSIAKTKTFRERLAEHADHRIDVLKLFLVDFLQFVR
jgi:hypothetical protein